MQILRKKKKKTCLNSVCERVKQCLFDSLFVFANQETSVISLEFVRKSEIVHIHDLPDVLYNPAKFQFNRIRTEHFQLKLFDTALTAK